MDEIYGYIRDKQPKLLASSLESNPQVLNKQDEDGRTPLMCALSESQDLEIVSEVLKAARLSGTLDVDLADNAGFTALHIAASLGGAFVEQLLPFHPAIDARTNNKQTPLFFSVSKQHVDAASLLIQNGASTKAKDIRQVSVLERAAALGSEKLVKLLLDNGAAVNATDAFGWTALHYAYAEDHPEVAEFLLANGADPEIQNNDEEKPEQLAPKRF